MRKSLTSIRPDADQPGHGPGKKDVVLRRFETPDEVRPMLQGSFDVVRIHGVLMGRATCEQLGGGYRAVRLDSFHGIISRC